MSLFRDVMVAALQPFARAQTEFPLTFQQWLDTFTFDGNQYQLRQTLTGNHDEIGSDFGGLIQGAYKSNGVVFACMLVRQLLFSEARFQYRRLQNGRPGDLFGDTSLRPLERPEPGKTTGDLLSRAIQDADLAGNAFLVRPFVNQSRTTRQDKIHRLRPDWVTMVLGSESDPAVSAQDVDAELIGLLYHPGGRNSGKDPKVYIRGEFAHFAPVPDPESPWRGMSWLAPIVREIQSDSSATAHKLKFFENGATPNMVVSLDPQITPEQYKLWMEAFAADNEGLRNAYKTLYLGGGASVEVVGKDLKQLDFKATQGAGETRIAAAAGVPPVIVGLSEGLQAATYSNYGQARRRLADGTMRPLWRNFAGSMEAIVPPPGASELWYDDRDIPFLREDKRDLSEIQGVESRSIRTLVDAGFEAASVVAAVESQDWTLLKHTGLFSVQLQPPGTSASGDPARAIASLIAPHLPRPDAE